MSQMEEELGLRLQEEHKALLQLCQVLREHIAAQPATITPAWLEGLRIAFERLHAHLQRSIGMKEKDGYLAAVVRMRPALVRRVEAIKRDNAQLLRMGFGIRNDLAAAHAEENVLVADLCARVLRYLGVVNEQEQRENMIVLFAFNQDLGGD